VRVLYKAEERHGSAEERLREMEAQLQEKDAEIQRVCVSLVSSWPWSMKELFSVVFVVVVIYVGGPGREVSQSLDSRCTHTYRWMDIILKLQGKLYIVWARVHNSVQ